MDTFWGADTEALRGRATDLEAAGRSVTARVAACTIRVRSAPWAGADAARFSEDWALTAGDLSRAAERLSELARELRQHADEQDRASAIEPGTESTVPAADPAAGSGGRPPLPSARELLRTLLATGPGGLSRSLLGGAEGTEDRDIRWDAQQWRKQTLNHLPLVGPFLTVAQRVDSLQRGAEAAHGHAYAWASEQENPWLTAPLEIPRGQLAVSGMVVGERSAFGTSLDALDGIIAAPMHVAADTREAFETEDYWAIPASVEENLYRGAGHVPELVLPMASAAPRTLSHLSGEAAHVAETYAPQPVADAFTAADEHVTRFTDPVIDGFEGLRSGETLLGRRRAAVALPWDERE
ncbi:MAG: hypothetical protein Q4G40_06325 [Brachybacterium sp.]|nr:hypothetical protein [Brachybacterium sp.]